MQTTSATTSTSARAPEVLTEATLKAAEFMAIKQAVLASILGLSPSTVSRFRHGTAYLDPNDKKSWELAALFVRLFRGLDALMGSDDQATQQWLRSYNTYLRGIPLDLITTVSGLVNVVAHVDAFRAKV